MISNKVLEADRSHAREQSLDICQNYLLLDAIEKAEQLAEPDIAEIVRDALQELEHPLNDLEDHPTQQ
jgi:hypothetical protein